VSYPINLLRTALCAFAVLLGSVLGAASAADTPAFTAIVLGASGGVDEGNLSAYLLAPRGSNDFIALDAGTLMAGLRKANAVGSLAGMGQPADSNVAPEVFVLQKRIKAYLISHAHLDHLMGLVINSPDDEAKEILGTNATIDTIRDHVFNGRLWPGFGNEGAGFNLKKYRYVRLVFGAAVPIAGTQMTVEALPLSHGAGYASTAFLVGAGAHYAAYFGDTGPDAIEKSNALQVAWRRLAPLVKQKALRGLFIEVSYPDGRPDNQLFGHLTPAWLMHELRAFARTIDPAQPAGALSGLTVFVTHVKPSLVRGEDPVRRIGGELAGRNDLGVRFVFSRQGERIDF